MNNITLEKIEVLESLLNDLEKNYEYSKADIVKYFKHPLSLHRNKRGDAVVKYDNGKNP